MSDLGFESMLEEWWRMLGANAVVAWFFRRELFWVMGGWLVQYLKEVGIEHVLLMESTWKVGYAFDTWSNFVDHL